MEVLSGLTREELLANLVERRRPRDTIDVPEWGGTLLVRRLAIEDLEGLREGEGEDGKPTPAMVRALLACLSDAEGNPLLSPEDVGHLMRAEADVATRAYQQIAELFGISRAAVEKATRDFDEAQDAATASD